MSFWTWATGYDEDNAAAAAAANARLQELNTTRYQGTPLAPIVEQNYQTQDAALGVTRSGTYAAYGEPTLMDYLSGNVGTDPFSAESQGAEIDKAAAFGAGGFWRGVTSLLKTILGGLPWWLWLVAGVALFLYLGGGPWLRKLIKTKMA